MNEDTRESIYGSLCCGLGVLLAVLFLGLSGCDQIEAVGINPAMAMEVEVEAERLKVESDNQPVLPDDLGGAQETVPEQFTPRKPTIAIRFFTQANCRPCVPAEQQIERFGEKKFADAGWTYGDWEPGVKRHVHIIRYEKHRELFDQYGVGWSPVYIKTADGKEVERRDGMQTREQLIQWLNQPVAASAPEVAESRPFAEPWRNSLPRQIRNLAHTDVDSAAIALPMTVLHLKDQSVQFSDSRSSRLNRWFSVSFGAGSVRHNGNSVEFSNPPELRFHLTDGGKGVRLDSLRSIEFTGSGADFHLAIGTIHFRVK